MALLIMDSNTFPIPEVCLDSCLSLCPQIMLLGLLFADHAFAAPELTGPEQLFRLRIPDSLNQLVLPTKDSMSKQPIFRSTVQTAYGIRICSTKQMRPTNLRNSFSR